MADSIRDRARKILDDNVPKNDEVRSEGPTAAAFTRMTGMTQLKLIVNWDILHKNLTSCNAFTGWFSRELGCDKYLGFFEMEDELKKMGREIAWVDARSGAKPKCGDIFRAKTFHVGISYDCTGEWETCEGGQGGSTQRYDIIKRKKRAYNPENVRGWIDIELFFAAQQQFAMTPALLTGWWKIEDSVNAEYWWFGTQQQNKNLHFKNIQRVLDAPTNLAQGPALPLEKGNFVVDNGGAITVSWKGKPAGEKFRQTIGAGSPTMTGIRRGIPVLATRMEA